MPRRLALAILFAAAFAGVAPADDTSAKKRPVVIQRNVNFATVGGEENCEREAARHVRALRDASRCALYPGRRRV